MAVFAYQVAFLYLTIRRNCRINVFLSKAFPYHQEPFESNPTRSRVSRSRVSGGGKKNTAWDLGVQMVLSTSLMEVAALFPLHAGTKYLSVTGTGRFDKVPGRKEL